MQSRSSNPHHFISMIRPVVDDVKLGPSPFFCNF